MHPITRKISCIFRGLPRHSRGRAHSAFNLNLGWEWRRASHTGQCNGIQCRQFGGIVRVNAVYGVAVNDPVLCAQILMLPIIMFVGFHDPHAGNTDLIEGSVMPPRPKRSSR